jgi:hypothetical protein
MKGPIMVNSIALKDVKSTFLLISSIAAISLSFIIIVCSSQPSPDIDIAFRIRFVSVYDKSNT